MAASSRAVNSASKRLRGEGARAAARLPELHEAPALENARLAIQGEDFLEEQAALV